MKALYYISVLSALGITACQKPYNPPATSTNINALVVEGFINIAADSTIIKLSRTVLVNSATTTKPETKAIVTVENAQGTIYALTETTAGLYIILGVALDNTKQYRLRIKTSNGKTYLSAFVNAKVTPPIDSIGYTIKSNGLQLYVNAHDATNNTRYYKYDYRETWQFNARYYTGFISNGTGLFPTLPSQQIYFCFGSDTSANTTINSTAALSQDIEYQFPITFIDATSEKVETKYSILLSQFALTADAYSFWQNLQKNTEQLGSIFDAQPSQLVGNINNIADASEPVIGYISAGTIQKKRVYITKAALPQSWVPTYPYSCSIDTAIDSPTPPGTSSPYFWTHYTLIPLPPAYDAIGQIINKAPYPLYVFTEKQCGDCTIRGTVKQPIFWK